MHMLNNFSELTVISSQNHGLGIHEKSMKSGNELGRVKPASSQKTLNPYLILL